MARRVPVLAALAALAAALAPPAAARTIYGTILDGTQEVPPNDSTAIGACLAALSSSETELTVTCVHTVVDATAAHIHEGAAGVNGPIVFPFPTVTETFAGVWELEPSDVVLLEAGELYVNIHSTAFPGGEIRGQLEGPFEETYSFALEEGQEVPPTGSDATGWCDSLLDPEATVFAMACQHTVDELTGAHIHNAPAGENGPIVFPLPSPASPLLIIWELTPGDVDALRAGNLYVNVHSVPFPNGEIRGQIVPEPPIFDDGFESGDTSSWDSTVD